MCFCDHRSHSTIVRELGVSKTFVIRWTRSPDQDCSLDMRGWTRGVRWKWDSKKTKEDLYGKEVFFSAARRASCTTAGSLTSISATGVSSTSWTSPGAKTSACTASIRSRGREKGSGDGMPLGGLCTGAQGRAPPLFFVGNTGDEVSLNDMEERIYRGMRLLAGETTMEDYSLYDFQKGGAFDTGRYK